MVYINVRQLLGGSREEAESEMERIRHELETCWWRRLWHPNLSAGLQVGRNRQNGGVHPRPPASAEMAYPPGHPATWYYPRFPPNGRRKNNTCHH